MIVRWCVGGALLVAIACGGACGRVNRQEAVRAVSVQSTTAQRVVFRRDVEIAGPLAAVQKATVVSEVSGVVQDSAADEGQDVHQGQVLIHIDPRELKLAVDHADSVLGQIEADLGVDRGRPDAEPIRDDQITAVRLAQASLENARAQNSRYEQMGGRGLIAAVEVEATRTRLRAAEAARDLAAQTAHGLLASLEDRRTALALARKAVLAATIAAPISGSIFESLVQAGEFIRESTPLVTIVQLDTLKVTAAVQGRYAGAVRVGMAVDVSVASLPNDTFRGEVVSVSPTVDAQTQSDARAAGGAPARTLSVEFDLHNADHRLKPGAMARAVIPTTVTDDVLAVSQDAVTTLAGVSTVFVLEAGTVRPQQVMTGARQNALVEILDGLKGGERLATTALDLLAAGVPVTDLSAGESGASAGRTR